ncbi:MAG: division/cell wall cluster transcriptional repressor MraZ [Alphaproteobacteria bacterium]
MSLFMATFVNKVDQKGRVSVPAPFRAALARQSFPGVIAFPSFTSGCIEGRGIDWMERLAAGIDDMAAFSPEQEEINGLIFSRSHQLPFDPEGRILLPEELVEYAALKGSAAFVGMGKYFQIWEPTAHKRAQAEALERARKKPPTVQIARKGEGS